MFASSRVDTDTEECDEEFFYTTPEDHARVSSADPTGEPSLFAYFTFPLSLLLLSFGCVSVRVTCPIPPVTPYKPCFPTTTYRLVCLFASLASRSAVSPMCVYLDLLSGYVGVCHMFHRILC